MKAQTLKSALFLLLLIFHPTPALAVTDFDYRSAEAPVFGFGDRCDMLGAIPEKYFPQLLRDATETDLNEFCRPEESFECGDYNPLLLKIGRLESDDNGYTCRLVPDVWLGMRVP